MRKHLVVALVAVALVAIFSSVQAEPPKEAQPMLCHDVYFSLKDNSPAGQGEARSPPARSTSRITPAPSGSPWGRSPKK